MPTVLVLLAVVLALAIGFGWGRARRDRAASAGAVAPQEAPVPPAAGIAAADPATALAAMAGTAAPAIGAEQARLVRSFEAEAAALRRAARAQDAIHAQLASLAEERRELFALLADARAQAARYRQLVIDIENDSPPPILGGPGTPDDLKLIVGVGPVLERMLHQLGITTYRQIARWSERDIDEFDARLAEFPGRIRRDAWVTQARALHQGLHGEMP